MGVMSDINLTLMTLSGEYSETTGYTPALTDHYFLTEPSEFLYTHYPSTGSSIEYTYSKDWQLVPTPISLAKCGNFFKMTLKLCRTNICFIIRFNKMPLLGSEFFTLGCSLQTEVTTPMVSENMIQIPIHADEVSTTFTLFSPPLVHEPISFISDNIQFPTFILAFELRRKRISTFNVMRTFRTLVKRL